ncbi:MAG: hypothetical protein ACKVPX_08490 [Myxococcaceae bacterium]
MRIHSLTPVAAPLRGDAPVSGRAGREARQARIDWLETPRDSTSLAELPSSLLAQACRIGPNASRAARAFADILHAQQANPDAVTRLRPKTVTALVFGVSQPRLGAHEAFPPTGLIGRAEVSRVLAALLQAPSPVAEGLNALLDAAAQSASVAWSQPGSTHIERALILKLFASRHDHVLEDGEGVLRELGSFAEEIRGLPRDELLATTTVIARGREAQGLRQRYRDSCAPSIAQKIIAEWDPSYARKLHASGPIGDHLQHLGFTAQEQLRILEKPRYMLRDTLEEVTGDLAALEGRRAAGELVRRQGFSASLFAQELRAGLEKMLEDRAVRRDLGTGFGWLNGYLNRFPERFPADVSEILLVLNRHLPEGLPRLTAPLLELARASPLDNRYHGMEPLHALADEVTPVTGLRYTLESALGHRLLPLLDRAAGQLENGVPIPIGVSSPLRLGLGMGGGHLMLMFDVRETAGGRSFYVADPATGKSTLLLESALIEGRGTFTVQTSPSEPLVISQMYLPV